MTLDDMLAAYDAAARAGDADAMAQFIAEDAVYFYSNGSVHVGRAAILRAIAVNRDTIKNDTFHTDDEIWLARGEDAALCIWHFAWTGEVDGKEVGVEGRGTTGYRRDGDRWLIVHRHLSAGAYRS